MNKPVWRMNTGNGVPSDLGDYFIFKSGDIREINKNNRARLSSLSMFVNAGCALDIVAYQTTRTREAKYERVRCKCCGGIGVLPEPIKTGDFTSIFCYTCNGKGHTLEAMK
jgi:hypothetical protein